MNIVLIGMRGAGKTTVAKLLSKKLKRQIYETDELIAKKACMSIRDIVEQYGWDYFRHIESEVIADLVEIDNAIISCGGGVIVQSQNTQILKKNGKIFWLQVSVPTLLKRIGSDTNRPSLTGKPQREDMEETIKARYNIYKNAADKIIDTEKLSKKEVANTVSSYLYRYGIGIASRNGTQYENK